MFYFLQNSNFSTDVKVISGYTYSSTIIDQSIISASQCFSNPISRLIRNMMNGPPLIQVKHVLSTDNQVLHLFRVNIQTKVEIASANPSDLIVNCLLAKGLNLYHH